MKWIIVGIDLLIVIFNVLGGGDMRSKPGFWRTVERVLVAMVVFAALATLCLFVATRLAS